MSGAPSLYARAQRRTYEILDGEVFDQTSRICEYFIASLVVLNVIAIILESVPQFHEAYAHWFDYFDVFSVVVFSIEYVLRVWSYGARYPEPK